ncbi:Reticulon-like protein [Actinidia chinensis var. chinensis]|uniref:Reticulon-like protein n=1 Tax=Actinidia chinensis var. chinensis TaxID=1590841 RepID=A0A2R6QC44_ACTCC|nr:Reticulon-like protein [Actinidia chinensis var. chinensis]
MDSTPPSRRSEPRLHLKSASRLNRLTNFHPEGEQTPPLSIDLVQSSPKISSFSLSPKPHSPLPLRKLLLLSPCPLRKSRTRLSEKLEMAEDPVEPNGSCRKSKNRNGSTGNLACGSPRNHRRSRRRLEPEIIEEREVGVDRVVEEMGKVRKRRHSGRSKKDKLSLVVSLQSPKTSDRDLCNLDRIRKLLNDLIMWNDVAKSSLWFGFGSLCFLSSCFARGINFSIFSFMSQLGLLFLGLSFFSNSICQRYNLENKLEYKLKEDDILRAARVILPTLNLAISKTRELFSGEPTMTLKVAPFLLIGAEYGHLMTLRRLCALGFFVSFTGPKLYSCYCVLIDNKVEYLKRWVLEAWGACSHKKIVAASAATVFWNLTAIRTRIFAAFIFVVILRYHRQHLGTKVEEGAKQKKENNKNSNRRHWWW